MFRIACKPFRSNVLNRPAHELISKGIAIDMNFVYRITHQSIDVRSMPLINRIETDQLTSIIRCCDTNKAAVLLLKSRLVSKSVKSVFYNKNSVGKFLGEIRNNNHFSQLIFYNT